MWPLHMAWDDGCLRLSGCKVDFHVNMPRIGQPSVVPAAPASPGRHWWLVTELRTGQTNFHQPPIDSEPRDRAQSSNRVSLTPELTKYLQIVAQFYFKDETFIGQNFLLDFDTLFDDN